MAIDFYSTRDEYGCFSNFSDHGFYLDDKFWKTSEHYFQAKKFEGTEYEEEMRLLKTPKEVADAGRDRNKPLRKDWETAKDEIMKKAVLTKFSVHKDLQEILLSTGDEELVEQTSDDYYWGVGTKGTGKNMLGKILMEVRTILRKKTEVI